MQQRAAGILVRRTTFRCTVLLVAILGVAPTSVRAQRVADPVDELKQAINNQEGEAAIRRRIADLHTLRDLSRAVEFIQYKMSPTTLDAARTDPVGRQLLDTLAKRFSDAAVAVLEKGSADERAATANLVGELAPKAGQPESTSAALRAAVAALVPPLAHSADDRDAHVRLAAIFALGKLPPLDAGPDGKPIWQTIVPAFKRSARTADPAQRLATFEAVANLFQTAQGSAVNTVAAAARFIEEALPLVDAGMQDPDPNLRRLSVENFRKAVAALNALITQLPALATVEEPKRLPSDTDLTFQMKIESHRGAIAGYRGVAQLADAFAARLPGLAKAATDPDAAIRMAAMRGYVDLTAANSQWNTKIQHEAAPTAGGASTTSLHVADRGLRLVSAEGTAPPELERLPKDKLATALGQQLAVLAAALGDPVPRVRLDALEALEALEVSGVDLKPIERSLTTALHDPDRFVRWAAARTLGRMGPRAGAGIVPDVAALLRDPDLDVRITAAQTLEHLGATGKNAVPALANAVRTGDAEFRIAVMHALTGIGAAAAPALDAVAAELGNPDARVRVAAAETLGRFGRLAARARAALNAATEDPDGGVRRAAAEAILSVAAPPSK